MFRKIADLLNRGRPAPEAAAPAPARKSPSPAPAAAPPAEPLVAIGARRPLVDGQGRVAGFEFRIPDATLHRLRGQAGGAAATAHARGLLASMRLTAEAGRLAYTELPLPWLTRPALAEEAGTGMLIALPHADAGAPFDPAVLDTIAALRARGAQVGWSAGVAQPVAPDFAVARPGAAAAGPAGLPVLAIDTGSIEALEAALRGGATYASCAIAERGDRRDGGKPIAPQAQRICQLLNRLVQEGDTGPIVNDIKADVGLSIQLLQHMNMAGVGGALKIDSVERAVALLGRNELYRWLSMLLVRFAAARPAASAMQETALARGRLLELLAADRREAAPGSFFTLGLASMLGLLLESSVADAIAPLHLPDPARDALLHQGGPWHRYLALADELQNPASDTATAMAEGFGGMEQVAQRSAEAWAWASRSSGTG